MKLLVASDLHGSFTAASRLEELMCHYQPQALVLLGDLLYHGPRNPFPDGYNPAKTAESLNGMSKRIIAVRGNCDSEVDQMVLSFELAPKFAWLFAGPFRIMAAHGHLHSLESLPEHTGFSPGDVFLSGHTHIPVAEEQGGLHFWNPGSMSLPKGSFPPSFGLFEDDTFSVLDFSGKLLLRDKLNA